MKLETFIGRFIDCLHGDPNYDWPAFGLILGAGASRSAGIPLTHEMVRLLRLAAKLAGVNVADARHESELSLLFRTVLQGVPPADEWSEPEREFLMGCISRALREPNITHLIAMHFVSLGLIGPVVTTNFDDLTLAGYWSLPYQTARREPHIIYDPLTSSSAKPRIAPDVPVIIKAHGHHTTYGLGILDKEIKKLASHVHETLRNVRKPYHGYIVIGYSGNWTDGVMAALCDRDLVKDRVIYWFHRGRTPPTSDALRRVASKAHLSFIQISDSDVLFLKLWREAAMAEVYNVRHLEAGWLFGNNAELLFSHPARYSSPRKFSRETAKAWWDPHHVFQDRESTFNYGRLVELRRELKPLLARIEQWDDDCMILDCLPQSLRKMAYDMGYPVSWSEKTSDLELLSEIPIDVQWTRRNRKLLRVALSRSVDEVMPFELLGALTVIAG
jgi:hypothetical protein